MRFEMSNLFDDASFTLFDDYKSDNDQHQEIDSVEGDNDKYNFIYIKEMLQGR